MSRTTLVICCKELREALRDRRAIFASLVATLAGPVLLGAVLMMLANEAGEGGRLSAAAVGDRAAATLPVFLVVSVFVMGMGLAIDSTAGERERQSLETLLATHAPSGAIAAGKWAAVAVMNVCGLLLTLICAVVIIAGLSFGQLGPLDLAAFSLPILAAGLPLAMLAAGLQVAVATNARTFKEGQTYLSMLLFLPMAIGMLSAFARAEPAAWRLVIPVFAQHQLIARALRGDDPGAALVLPAVVAIVLTIVLLRWTASLMTNDRILYG